MIKLCKVIIALMIGVPAYSAALPSLKANDLQGEWKQPCQITVDQDVVKHSLQISGENWVWISTGFEKNGCEVPYLSLRETKKALFTETGLLDLTLVKAEYLPQSPGVAKTLNEIHFCGLNNWLNGVAQEVSGLVCSDYKIPQRGENIYTIFKEESPQPTFVALSLGQAEPGFDGSSPEKRHRVLSVNPYYRMLSQAKKSIRKAQ